MIPTPTQVYEALRYRIEIGENGSRRYYNSAGQLHRMEGPAVEWEGGRRWYQNDRLHHIDGPAVAMYGAMQSGSYTVDDYQKQNSIEP